LVCPASGEEPNVPREKNFKRLVRSRMAKTGEWYTTARSRIAPAQPSQSWTAGDPDAGGLARALAVVGVVNPISWFPFTEELLFGVGGGIGSATPRAIGELQRRPVCGRDRLRQ